MTKEPAKDASYSSGLHKPGMWIFLFAFFAVLPIFIYLSCYENYLENEFISDKERVIKYYQRELTSFRNRANNSNIFQQQLQNFRDSCCRNLPEKTAENLQHSKDLQEELPRNFSIIQWNGRDEIIASFTRLSGNFPPELAGQFVQLLVDSHLNFSAGKDLQTLQQTRDFETRNRQLLTSLRPLTGRHFPITQICTGRSTIQTSELADVMTFWDFFNNKDNSQGGFVVIIPRANLSPTFALSKALTKDPSANPESTNGLFDTTSGKIELSFPPLLPIAEKMVSGYRNDVTNPFSQGDWVLFVQPVADSSSANIFSMFSVRSLREGFENSVKSSQIASLVLILVIGLIFMYAFRLTVNTGLSLRRKLTGLFLLIIQLPISILIFLGIQYSLSKERLLSIEADQKLTELVRKVDYSALDYYRSLTEWLKTFSSLPELQQLDREKLHQRFFKYSHEKQLENFYLVGIDGTIEFDIENLGNEQSNKLFMRELGVKILAGYSSHEVSENDNPTITEGILDQVITQRSQLHQIVWPGSGERKFIFTDVAQDTKGRPIALIAILDKTEVDRNYLRQAITNQHKSNPDHELFVIHSQEIAETIPKLSPTFRANLLPMLSTARISSNIETDRITGERDTLLVALGHGNNIANFLIGARANWAKIVESIRSMYFLVFIGLFFSLAASIFMITVLLREFLTPISILSSGAKSIIGGNLDLDLQVFSRDELGELSETFNFMTRRLKNRLTELTVLYNMTQKASTSHNQREIFMLVAENLLKHLHGDSFGTAWINEGEGEDSIYLAEHHPDEVDEAIRGVVRNCLRTYKTTLEKIEAINRYVLGIPLYFEEKKFGAVYLLFALDRFKEPASFSEDEKSFIETLRHHLALIIEKQRLFEQAITDGLTKLYVRRFFLATLEKEMARSKRYQLDVSVLLIDIDHFKKFNDTYGHQAGDMVLRETAQRLIECIRSVDTPGRYGGEEMAILLPQTNIKEAFIVAERIKKAVESSEYNYRDYTMKVTVSIGVSALHNRQVTVEEIIEEADRALYVAKDKGRNQVRIAPEAM